MLEALLPALGVLAGLWLLISAAMAWGARRAAALAEVPAPGIFAAPPRAAQGAERARIAFLGDVQRGIADIIGPLERHLPQEQVDLLVSSGDLVSHGEAPYYGIVCAAFGSCLAENPDQEIVWSVPPTRVAPGNHDLFPRRSKDDRIGGALFEARFGPRHWALHVGPVLIVGIDNGADWLIDDQLPWLEQTLAEHAGVPWILVCHRPFRHLDQEERPWRSDHEGLRPVLAGRPPALVVCGHLHEYMDVDVEGIRWIVNAHGGDVHGLGIRRGQFQVVYVDASAEGLDVEVKGYDRRRNASSYADQLAVRFWSDRRKPWGAVLAWPGRMILKLFGADVPVVRHAEERRPPDRETLIARRREGLPS